LGGPFFILFSNAESTPGASQRALSRPTAAPTETAFLRDFVGAAVGRDRRWVSAVKLNAYLNAPQKTRINSPNFSRCFFMRPVPTAQPRAPSRISHSYTQLCPGFLLVTRLSPIKKYYPLPISTPAHPDRHGCDSTSA